MVCFFFGSPAPGYRHPYSGTLYDIGNHGYSWSSTVSGIAGVFLIFSTQDFGPSNTNCRAYGFQLRCLSE
ncbi:hypothetical protein [uncultured Rikenella sp.]|uniref:hypothetical protein n=1 Tax=uncultured Rikenella sp. TaxID=368003 RepID=UPI002636FA6C|nr:hypothetical protein [uncultured Rikenella sp.]